MPGGSVVSLNHAVEQHGTQQHGTQWSLRSMPCTNLVSERLACALALSYHSSAMSLVSHALMSRTLRGLHDIDVGIFQSR